MSDTRGQTGEGGGVVRSPTAALTPACGRCDGRGFHTKESTVFAGTTFRVNCLACGGSGVEPARQKRARMDDIYRLGFAGSVARWTVAQIDDTPCATPDGGNVEDTRTIGVPGLARWVASARELKVGWGRFPDGAEAVILYDADDGGYGFAFNVTAPQCSGWGYAPWGREAA